MAPFPWWLALKPTIYYYPPRAGPTRISWLNSSPGSSCSRGGGEWMGSKCFTVSLKRPTEISWKFSLQCWVCHTIQHLIQPLYGFLGLNLSWNRDWNNFYQKHASSDIVISSEFRSLLAKKHSLSLKQLLLTFFPNSI